MYKDITKYYIVTALSKDKNILKWVYENFPKTIEIENKQDEYFKITFKVDKMGSWEQTREYINLVKKAYNNLLLRVTPVNERINTFYQ